MRKINAKLLAKNIITASALVSMLFQSALPFTYAAPAYAQEATVTPTATDTITPTDIPTTTPTDTITPTPTQDQVSPTPTADSTPTLTPTDTVTPAPSDTVTAVPTPDTTTPTSEPNANVNSQGPPSNNSTSVTPTQSAPTITPTVTPADTTDTNGTLGTTIVKNVSASSLDLSAPTSQGSATISTDKADYHPTDTAVISGSGFLPNYSYTLEITSSDAPAVDFTTTVTTDNNGGFVYGYQLDGNYRPNYSVAVEDGSTTVATTTFTDDAGTPTGNISATYDASTHTLITSGGYSWSKCTSNNKDPLGYALFKYSGNPTTADANALDGAGMQQQSCTSTSGTWGPHTYTNITLNASDQVCVVLYHIGQNPPSTGEHSKVGAGTGYNTDNSWSTNNNSYGIQVVDGKIDLNQDGTVDNNDDGTLDGKTIKDGVIYVLNTNTKFTGTFDGFSIIIGEVDFNGDGGINKPGHPDTGSFSTSSAATCVTPTIINQPLSDLTVTKTDDVNGTTVENDSFNWTITVKNNGSASATFTNGQTILSDNLPNSNATYGSATVVTGGNITGTVSCSVNGLQDLSCTASGNVTIPSGGTITITLPVTSGSSIGTLTNPRASGVCSVDPNNNVIESNEANNSCSDSVSVVAPTSVTICHATSSTTNPYVMESPNIKNNGDLTGGHLNHTGPVYPGANWGDIIPPYTYGSFSYPGLNWTTGGQAIWNNNCTVTGTLVVHKIFTDGHANQGITINLSGTATGSTQTNANGDATFSNLAAGTYSAVAVEPSGYYQSATTCTNVPVTNGQQATCTITDSPILGTITVHKNLVGTTTSLTSFCFTLNPDPNKGQVCANANGDAVFTNVPAGTYTASETASAANYSQTATTCNTGMAIANNGDSKSCTITNTRDQGSINFVKVVSGGSSIASDWTFTISGQGTAKSGDTKSYDTGSYTVTESGPTGYTLTDASGACALSNGTVTLSVTKQGGTCTLTNTRDTGTIELTKVWSGATSQTTLAIGTKAGASDVAGVQVSANGTTVTTTVNTGTYYVSESSLADYTATLSCTDNGNAVTLGANNSVTVNKGDAVVCTYTNTRNTADLQAVKVVNDGSDLTQWSFALDNGTPVQADSKGTVDFGQVTTNVNHTITESGPTGYHLFSVDGANCTSNYDGVSATANIPNGTTSATCTFTNNRDTGTITVDKVTDPSGDAQKFTFDLSTNNSLYDSTKLADQDTPHTFTNVPTGTYSLTEGATNGWDLSTTVCSNDQQQSVDPSNIVLTYGENVSCTFTNIKRGSITIVKSAEPQGSTSFDFTGDLGNFSLVDDGTNTQNSTTVTNLVQGTYTVTEPSIKGWDLTDITCVGGSNVNTNNRNAVIKLQPGENVTCTFTNTQEGSISGEKFLDDNANGQLDTGEVGIENWTIQLEDNKNTVLATTTTDANGNYTFTNLSGGTYNVCEVMQDGWNRSYPTNSNCQTVTLSKSSKGTDNVTNINFGNYQNATITVIKKVIDPDGNDVTNDNTSFPFTIDQLGASFNLSNGQVATYSAKPGTYGISEDYGTNYAGTGCTAVYNGNSVGTPVSLGTTQGESVTLGSNDSVVVTCVNQQKKAQVSGFKWNDVNGNGEYDCTFNFSFNDEFPFINLFSCESKLSGWTIFADANNNQQLDNGEVSTTTDSNGDYTLSLNPGTYNICEVMQNGWKQTYPASVQQSECYNVTLNSNDIYSLDGEEGFNFGNQIQIPILTINKFNNTESANMHPGDNILYTITVTATQAAALNVTVTDLLPKGFAYVPGSWTANVTGGSSPEECPSGDLKACGITTEPTYHSPGTWKLGDMSIGETITLTLLATVSDVQPGIYKDLTWGKGQSALGDTVLANENSGVFVFVGTDVHIVNDKPVASFDTVHTQDVLGASTMADTGANVFWIDFAISLLLLGFASGMIGFALRRKYND